jgi:hypothetical protein
VTCPRGLKVAGVGNLARQLGGDLPEVRAILAAGGEQTEGQ